MPARLSGAKPGMEVDVEILLEQEPNALVLPRQALHRRNGQSGVFLAMGDIARWQSVTAGAGGARELRITAGLVAGEWVIVTPDPRLEDGRSLWIASSTAAGNVGDAR